MPHASLLAFESVTYASVMSMVFGSLLLIMYRGGVRIPGMRLLVLAWYCTSLYFFLFAISSGSAQVVLRGQVALLARVWLMLTFTLFGFSYVAIFRSFLQANDIRRWLW